MTCAPNGRSRDEELQLLLWQRKELTANSAGGDVPLMLPQVEQRIRKLSTDIMREKMEADRLANDVKTNDLSIRAGEMAREIIPGLKELKRLKSQQATLESVLDDPQARAKVANLAEVENVYRRVSQQIEEYKPPLDALEKPERAHA